MRLRPFIRYYGGKWRAAPRYPKPEFGHIIEPFAGAAGYSMRYPDLAVTLVERYAVLAEMWRYLIAVPRFEIQRIPLVDHIDDLPGWVPAGGRALVGWTLNAATVSPSRTLSSGRRKLRDGGCIYEGWSQAHRECVAAQVGSIRHWRVVEGDYTEAPDVQASWFIDPPYNNRAGSYYVHGGLDYTALGEWCKARQGQTMVCENEGADWLPSQTFATFKAGLNGHGSREVLWYHNDQPRQPCLFG